MIDIGALFGLEAGLSRLIVIGLLGALALGGVAYAVLESFVTTPAASRRIDRGGRDQRAGVSAALMKTNESAQERRRALERADQGQRSGFSARLEQAALTVQPPIFIALFVLGAVGAGVAAVVAGAPPLWAAGGAAAFVLIAPNLVLSKLINSRREAFVAAFPTAIDMMVRGVKAGQPLNESMKIIANEMEGPIGEEFERMIAATNVGFSLEEATEHLANRIESPDVNFFRTVIVIQKQTGGGLAEALGNLSTILRERQKLRKKVWALSSEARTSAIVLGSLPILVGLAVYLMRPEYLRPLFENPGGQMVLGGAGVWMLIGALVMRAMIKIKI